MIRAYHHFVKVIYRRRDVKRRIFPFEHIRGYHHVGVLIPYRRYVKRVVLCRFDTEKTVFVGCGAEKRGHVYHVYVFKRLARIQVYDTALYRLKTVLGIRTERTAG